MVQYFNYYEIDPPTECYFEKVLKCYFIKKSDNFQVWNQMVNEFNFVEVILLY